MTPEQVDQTLWPEFQDLSTALSAYLSESPRS